MLFLDLSEVDFVVVVSDIFLYIYIVGSSLNK